MEKQNKPGTATSNVNEPIKEIGMELTELGIDSFLQEGLIKDIPIAGMVMSLVKIGVGISDRLLIKKLVRFITEARTIPMEKREAFLLKFESEKKYREKIGESLLLLIDKLNDFSKADYLGKLFAAVVEEKIDYVCFLKLAGIIDKCHPPDLHWLISMKEGRQKEIADIDKDILFSLGLLTNMGVNGGTFIFTSNETAPNKKIEYQINEYGQLLIDLILQPKN